MVLMDIKFDDSYWKQLEITPKDIEFLYSFLLEEETPLPSGDVGGSTHQRNGFGLNGYPCRRSNNRNGEFYLPESVYNVWEIKFNFLP